ncbi:Hint domain-containing protein [Tropicibacter sp. R16_0]|uniref:Hint domain-containing protein n=1 Tax=Tropicibacter sp. R16_0 TaxID=2821102 RepID=UPI001ADBF5BB|nr:Hint domain-containing protein [Tropicibacter sp. R16_0]MBO9452860.1 Hint domain-containing protein [Tropicibacter sp. R16_0]
MVSNAPRDAINITITGDTTGSVTGSPPNVATGDLDADVDLPNPGWTLFFSSWDIADAPDLGAATINPTTGEWTYTVDQAEFDALDDGEIVQDTFLVEVSAFAFSPGGQLFVETETQQITINIEGVCFVMGTLIRAVQGYQKVEDLRVGDKVWTRDHGMQRIRWIESSAVRRGKMKRDPLLRPVRISKGALGRGQPRNDLYVSQQHRILLCGPAIELMFGGAEALARASDLCHWPGIEIVLPDDDIHYFHILLDRHEILDADGVPAESLFLGEEALYQLSSEALQELSSIFDDDMPEADGLRFGKAARMLLRSYEAQAILHPALTEG